MGQGKASEALQAIRSAAKAGGWVCLQNLHLVISWLSELSSELAGLQLHPKFRLWMTTEEHIKFPISLLNRCLKITTEPPPGLKRNLLRTYQNWTPEFLQKGSVERAQSLFVLAWFHAVIQERRKYIPESWIKFYEFSAADLRSSGELINVAL